MQNVPTRTAFLIASAIGATAALPMLAKAGPAPVPSFQAEKCFGVAVAGKNDAARMAMQLSSEAIPAPARPRGAANHCPGSTYRSVRARRSTGAASLRRCNCRTA